MKKKIIGILDYGMGNILSVSRAIEKIGCNVNIIQENKNIDFDFIILPGVGSFDVAMGNIKTKGLEEVIYRHVERGRPLLGICLGMQLLFEFGTEGAFTTSGLGLVSGHIEKIYNNSKIKTSKFRLPNIGWRELVSKKNYELVNGKFFYFVHSYYANTSEDKIIASSNYYGLEFPAIIKHRNIIGTQFHPEKSSTDGLNLLDQLIFGNYYE